jgi:type II secretory pathway pseudopilin PulG
MKTRAGTHEGGFSMIELLVAMAMTLVVTGAIFGLLTAGHNAFRREPELADRQQNIRVAMDLISRDIEGAGNGMTPFVQAFTDGLDAAGPAGPGGVNSDYLEILLNDGLCPTLDVAGSPGAALHTTQVLPACFDTANSNGFMAYMWGSSGPANSGLSPGIVWIHTPAGGKAGGPCGGGTLNTPSGGGGGQVNLNGNGTCGGGSACTNSNLCQNISLIQVVRYEIAPDPNDPTTPALWRSPTGTALNGALSNNQPPNAPWQFVARGIEDLQIRYLTGAGWADTPGPVTQPNYATIVREVQVTLSGRSTAPNLQGETTSALVGTGKDAVRGQLVSVISPRAAQLAVHQGNLWR